MAKVNVAQFATELKLSADKLVEQLKAAGVKKALTEKTSLTEADKTKLLEYLRSKIHVCLTSEQRMKFLAESSAEARDAYARWAALERRYEREGPPPANSPF